MGRIIRVAVFLLLLVATGAGGYNFYLGRSHCPAPLTVSGYIEATEVRVGFESAGRVVAVVAAEGDLVKEGAVLARLDDREARLRLAEAAAVLRGAEARLAELKAGSRAEQVRAAQAAVAQAAAAEEQAAVALAAAERELKRVEQLCAQEAVPPQQVDAARDARDSAAQQLAARRAATQAARAQLALVQAGATAAAIRNLSAAVDQARAARDLARLNLERTVLKAPVGGTVAARLVDVGATVAPGTPGFTIADLRDLWVRVYVPEPALGKVRLGQRVTITVDSFPGRHFAGRVIYIAPEAEFTPRNVQTPEGRSETVFAVKVAVLEGAGMLKPGMLADVVLEE